MTCVCLCVLRLRVLCCLVVYSCVCDACDVSVLWLCIVLGRVVLCVWVCLWYHVCHVMSCLRLYEIFRESTPHTHHLHMHACCTHTHHHHHGVTHTPSPTRCNAIVQCNKASNNAPCVCMFCGVGGVTCRVCGMVPHPPHSTTTTAPPSTSTHIHHITHPSIHSLHSSYQHVLTE